jgi:hypothetical protein
VRDVGAGANRQLALTDEGREVAFSSEDRNSGRWSELVRDAAVRPRIHRQVLDQFDGTHPDDRVVLHFLLFELGFIDDASAKDFLNRLRATLTFARMDADDTADGRASVESNEADSDDFSAEDPASGNGPAVSGIWRAPTEGPASATAGSCRPK